MEHCSGGDSLRRSFCTFIVNCAVFFSGAFSYGMIELLARGHTHITMGLLGGAAMVMIHYLNEGEFGAAALFLRLLVSAFCITAAELFAGLILNVRLGLHIWNYSKLPLNLYGQICPAFSLIWFSLSGLGFMLDSSMRYCIFNARAAVKSKVSVDSTAL